MSIADYPIKQLVEEVPAWPAASGGSYESIKPSLDFAMALVLLVLTAPLMIVAILLVRLTSRGSAIYTQRRLGLGGKIFTIYKIRSMYRDCERNTGAIWSLPGDPRVTPVGRALRFTHLDELPQLINILLGEMSLVGPRPERPEFLARLERALPDYRRRLSVRPGVTGLAQVQQPPDTDLGSVRSKLQFDLCYVDRMNPWLDFRIVLTTALKCVGVPFTWIGPLLQLPVPDDHRGGDSRRQDALVPSESLAPEPYLAQGPCATCQGSDGEIGSRPQSGRPRWIDSPPTTEVGDRLAGGPGDCC